MTRTRRKVMRKMPDRMKVRFITPAREAVAQGKRLTWSLVRGLYYLMADGEQIAHRTTDVYAVWFHGQLLNEGLIAEDELSKAICRAHDDDIVMGGIIPDDLEAVLYEEDEE